MYKVLITTVPFAEKNPLPLKILRDAGIEYSINPLNKKLTEDELADLVTDFDVIIAGTEPITEKVMIKAKNLKLISRVGIGLDSVDLLAAERMDISVSYTPDAPAPAVAELTMASILTLLRSVHVSNLNMHKGEWYRYFGRRISEVTIGIIGLGRIGTTVLKHLKGFGNSKILTNDIKPNTELEQKFSIEWVNKKRIYEEADIISLHIPLTRLTKNLIQKEQLQSMKKDAMIINTSRGRIINEKDLVEVMKSGHLSGASVDVFESEPYSGPLKDIDRCLLTAHMGSMSVDCRFRMELEATEETIRFLSGKLLKGKVPQEEYDMRREGR